MKILPLIINILYISNIICLYYSQSLEKKSLNNIKNINSSELISIRSRSRSRSRRRSYRTRKFSGGATGTTDEAAAEPPEGNAGRSNLLVRQDGPHLRLGARKAHEPGSAH